MKYLNKNDIKSAIIIVVVSVIIALLYNILRGDGCSGKIPFFKASKENLIISDDELFGNNAMPENTELQIQIKDTLTPTIDTTSIEIVNNTDTTKPDIYTLNEDKLDYESLFSEAKKSSSADYGIITKEQMKKIVADNSDNFIIIDARRPEDYKESRIGSAINIFPYDDDNIVFEKIQALPMSKTMIVYCDGGDCDSSHKLGNLLNLLAYKFFIYEGGWEEWNK
ncbi:MAG: rhodanese-like domain-containing protein [Bacteroidetes bacterium]|nr:rhodanese-like domain-containing protein [Bacteroidota bacterium]